MAVNGFYDRVRELSSAERAEIAALPFDEARYLGHVGAATAIGEPGYTTLERQWTRPTLEVNGTSVGPLPMDHPLRVPAGTVVLGVRAPGFFPMQRVATVVAGQLGREQIDLVPQSQSP